MFVIRDPLPAENNEEALALLPPIPSLNRLTLSQDEKRELRLPLDLVKQWTARPFFAVEFNARMDAFLANPACEVLSSVGGGTPLRETPHRPCCAS